MDAREIIAACDLELFVRDIFIFRNDDPDQVSRLPIFADGYPGIMYRRSSDDALLLPRRKKLSRFFLYGQTIAPIEFLLEGQYLLIVFQLYPFASKLLFDVDPRKLNDDCYNLSPLSADIVHRLEEKPSTEEKAELIAQFVSALAREKSIEEYGEIQRAIGVIVEHRGLVTVGTVARTLEVSERTLQRKFRQYVGISPKKFAKIIQFQTSVEQIESGSFSKLTDVVYESGYADQSHFIRNIKKFTGKRPLQLKQTS